MGNLQFVADSAASISLLVIIDYPLDRQYRQLREQLGWYSSCTVPLHLDYLESNIMSECLSDVQEREDFIRQICDFL